MKIYLTVMTFTDTSMLMSIFLISKQFSDNAHSHENELYWKSFGLVQWFYIAFGMLKVLSVHQMFKWNNETETLSFGLLYSLYQRLPDALPNHRSI